jgi:hypothetical protein
MTLDVASYVDRLTNDICRMCNTVNLILCQALAHGLNNQSTVRAQAHTRAYFTQQPHLG